VPPEVVTATGLFADGDWEAAESLVRPYLLQHGNQIEAMRLPPDWHCAQVYDDAELLLAQSSSWHPIIASRARNTRGCHRTAPHEQARRELDRLLTDEPDSRS